MNFSLQTQPPGEPKPAGRPQAQTREVPPRERPQPPGRRSGGGAKAAAIVAAVVLGGAIIAFTSVPGLGNSVAGLFKSSDAGLIRYKAQKGKLPVVVTEKGSLESSKNIDVINEVEGMTTIISIVPEGTQVKKGDKVCELDSATLRDNLTNQEIATKRAESDLEQTKKNLEVAEISVKEYVEGTYPSEEQSALGQIKLAESELVKAKERLDWSDKNVKLGYVSPSANYADKLARDKAEFSLNEAKKKLEVLRKYTKGKKITELKAEVEKARSDMLAKQETYNLEKSKEQKLRDQISKTILRAPNDGLVVYANETNRFGGNNQPQIEEGAQVRERQKIFSLPDISRMRVNTKVHESMIDRITPGLSARLRVDAFAGQVLNGKVESVQPLPDPSSFFASDIKVYTTQVAIDKGHGGLRPGMTAQVEILVTQLDDVISTPVQSILEFKGKDHVYVITPEGPVRREVKLGISNDKFVEIKEGLKAGEEVAMNPGSLLTEAEKREAFATSAKGATKKEWSKEAIAAGKTAGAPGAPGAGGDPAKKKDASKKKGGRGGMANNPIMQKIRGLTTKNLTPEEQAKLRDFSLPQSEREALYKKAGVTPEDLEQMKEAFKKMMEAGGGGFGGGPPGGGFGGGPGGGGGFGGGGGQPQ